MANITEVKLGDGVYKLSVQISSSHTKTTATQVVYSISNGDNGLTYYSTRDLSLSSLTCSSEVQAPGFYATSDVRLKENIEDSNSKELIQTFDELSSKYFSFKNDEQHKKQVGLIAQDLEEIIPEDLKDCFIKKGEDGYLSINENKLVYLCIEKIKQLELEIQTLKNSK